MNKTTTTMLMAAGLIVLAGCKSDKVMDDRRFPAPENDAAVTQKDPAVRGMTPIGDENGKNSQAAVSKKEQRPIC